MPHVARVFAGLCLCVLSCSGEGAGLNGAATLVSRNVSNYVFGSNASFDTATVTMTVGKMTCEPGTRYPSLYITCVTDNRANDVLDNKAVTANSTVTIHCNAGNFFATVGLSSVFCHVEISNVVATFHYITTPVPSLPVATPSPADAFAGLSVNVSTAACAPEFRCTSESGNRVQYVPFGEAVPLTVCAFPTVVITVTNFQDGVVTYEQASSTASSTSRKNMVFFVPCGTCFSAINLDQAEFNLLYLSFGCDLVKSGPFLSLPTGGATGPAGQDSDKGATGATGERGIAGPEGSNSGSALIIVGIAAIVVGAVLLVAAVVVYKRTPESQGYAAVPKTCS